MPAPSADRLLFVSGTFIHEFDLASFGKVSLTGFAGGTVRDAVLAGPLLVITTTSGNIVFTPVGDDDRQVPNVADVAPAQVATSGGGLATITGSSFTYATQVSIDGVATPFTVVDDTTITATIPPHAGGAVSVTVTNPKGTSDGGPGLTYVAARPQVTALSPPGGPTAGGNTVTITGSDLGYATAVTFGSTPAQSFTTISGGRIKAVAPVHVAGSVDVTVTTAGGTSEAGPATAYAYDGDAPAVTSLTPNSGPRSGGQTVEIRGRGFYGATKVEFGPGATSPSFQVLSDTLVRATTPAHAAGGVSVQVTTANGTSAPDPWVTWYAFLDPAPTVTSVSPASGPSSGGTMVVVRGTGFTGATAVRFGTTPAQGFAVLDQGLLLATAPVGAPGPTAIRVTTPSGSSNPATATFTYGDPPTVTGVSPAAGPTGGGQVVTITGTGLTGATTVELGAGEVAAFFQVVSDTRIDVFTPPHAAGLATVLVTTPFGTSSATSAPTYQYGGAIAGTVTDSASGDPLEGVRVNVYAARTLVATTRTDAAGSYDAVVADGGEYQVRFLSTGTHVTVANGGAMGLATAPLLTVVPGEALVVDAAMRTKASTGSVAGTVTDRGTGGALAGVGVSLFMDGVRVRTVRTDADGDFSVIGLDPDRVWTLRYSGGSDLRTQFWPASPKPVAGLALPVEAGEVTDASTAMTRKEDLAGVAGVVVDDGEGSPVAGVRVLLMLEVDPGRPGVGVLSTVTDAAGAYSFSGLIPGTYQLRYAKDGYRMEFWEEQAVRSAATPLSVGVGADLTCDVSLAMVSAG